MTRMRSINVFFSCAFLAVMIALACAPARAAEIHLSPQASQALDQIYSGNPDVGISTAHTIEQSDPQNPLGFAIEAEALWWGIYCESCEVQWGMVDAWKGGKGAEGDAYLKLADKVVQLANAQLAKKDTAEMRLYAGMGWALEARLYGLRGDRRKTARTGVEARDQFVRALRLDPNMADADVGLGLYNYYVDTLSPMLKFLRFFMGIPGGSKQDGIRQLKNGMDHGALLSVVARFYLAKDLRTYDHQYGEALSIAEPLAGRYPRNPIFLLLVGNLDVELGRNDAARTYIQSAVNVPNLDGPCASRVTQIANALLAQIHQ